MNDGLASFLFNYKEKTILKTQLVISVALGNCYGERGS